MLEELLQQFADALEAERDANWLQGDVAAKAVEVYGREVLGKFAEVGRCSVERVRQMVRLAAAFPEEHRYKDVPWSWYRAVYQAARRLKRDHLELLEEALQNEYSAADLAGLGKEKAVKVKLTKKCGWCGARVSVEAEGELAGEIIHCPVCLAASGEKRQLGVLEVVR